MKKIIFLNILLFLANSALGMLGTAGHLQFRKPQTPKFPTRPLTPIKKPSISPGKTLGQPKIGLPEEGKPIFEQWLKPSQSLQIKPITVESYKMPYVEPEASLTEPLEESIFEKRTPTPREMAEQIRREVEKQATIPASEARKEQPAPEYPMYREPSLITPEVYEVEEISVVPHQPRELTVIPQIEKSEYQQKILTPKQIESRKIELVLRNFNIIAQHVLEQLPYEESRSLVALQSPQSIAQIASHIGSLKGVKQPQVVWILEQFVLDIAKRSGYSPSQDTIILPDDAVLQSLLSKAVIKLDSLAKQIEEVKQQSRIQEQRYQALPEPSRAEPVYQMQELSSQAPIIPFSAELIVPEIEPIRAIEIYKEPERLPEIQPKITTEMQNQPVSIGKELAVQKPEEKRAQEKATKEKESVEESALLKEILSPELATQKIQNLRAQQLLKDEAVVVPGSEIPQEENAQEKEFVEESALLKEIFSPELAMQNIQNLRAQQLIKDEAILVSGGKIPPTGKRPRDGALAEGDENGKRLRKTDFDSKVKAKTDSLQKNDSKALIPQEAKVLQETIEKTGESAQTKPITSLSPSAATIQFSDMVLPKTKTTQTLPIVKENIQWQLPSSTQRSIPIDQISNASGQVIPSQLDRPDRELFRRKAYQPSSREASQMPMISSEYPEISHTPYAVGTSTPQGIYSVPVQADKIGNDIQSMPGMAQARTQEGIPFTPSYQTNDGFEGIGGEAQGHIGSKAPLKILEKEEMKEYASQMPLIGFGIFLIIMLIIASYILWRQYIK